MRNIITTILFFSALVAFGQAPLVPKKIMFADMELTISNSARAEIQSSINSLHKNPKYFQGLVDQANLFFPIIEAEFAKQNFPDDIKYLCIQESGFKASAVSTSNAVGYWQFKEATAIEQGLQVDRHIDERKNIVSSSEAAAKYMTAHNKKLDNWIYAVVAYNTGLGGVQKFYKSSYAGEKKVTIDRGTHWYFLKFLAHKIAFEDYVGKTKTATVLEVDYQLEGKSMKDIAKDRNLSLDELTKYNMWIENHKKIPSAAHPYPVVFPVANQMYAGVVDEEKTQSDQEKLEPVTPNHKKEKVALDIEETKNKNVRYKVNGLPAITAVEGDNSSRLAIKGGITRVKFLKHNEIKSFEDLVPGQTYFLKKKRRKSRAALQHTAEYGEDLWAISQHYGVREASLRNKNRMLKYETVQPGRVIWLKGIRPADVEIEYKAVKKPKEEPIVTPEVVKEVVKTPQKEEIVEEKPIEEVVVVDEGPQPKYTHWVQPQETLDMIAHYYLIEVSQIKEWNALESDKINVGDKLKIMESSRELNIVKDTAKIETIEIEAETKEKVEGETISPELVDPKSLLLEDKNKDVIVRPSRFINVWVEPGTTLYGLAKQHNVSVDDIKKYNHLKNNTLNAGDKLAIPVYEVEENLGGKKIYIVQAGDTLFSISQKLGVSVETLKLKNKKTENALLVGEELKY